MIKINEKDNVAVIVETGHKVALTDIKQGEDVVKYGFPIGMATQPIKSGEHVHTHNLKTKLGGIESYTYNPALQEVTENLEGNRTFMGYRRKDGKIGIRNEIWIINTVGCVNKTAERIASKANRLFSGRVDGVFTFVHPCGCSQLGDDHYYTQNILKGMVEHPNAAGVLVLGLGCENNHIDEFKKILGTWDEERVKFLSTQDVDDEEAVAHVLIKELVSYAETFQREEIPAGELVIGLKCGGSDGLSGITANVLTGKLSDAIIAQGGSCLLTEVPEMFGAETLLMDRCVDEDVFNKTVSLINNFKDYFTRHGQTIYENPSPGNKEGGITTLEEKSLGCTQKGGISKVIDVLDYGETVKSVKKPGLSLLQGPGNDIVAVTNLTAAGAHIIIFTTGRGTPLGAPVPTVKVSSNTVLAERKAHWIDFDAGVMVHDTKPADPSELGQLFFEYILEIASGTLTKNELNGYREIAIFKDGVTL